jgi:serine O-acetyltransferase
MFSRLREDISCVFERDPAARSTWEVLTCYPGFHALTLHRSRTGYGAHACAGWRVSFAFHALAHRHRDPSRGNHRAPGLHRPRHGRGHRRDGGDRGRMHAVSRRHPGRHLLEQGQAPSDPAARCGDRRRRQGTRPITLGVGAKVGSNAVVVRDVPPGATAVGIPARIIEDRSEIDREVKAGQMGFSAYAVTRARGRSAGPGDSRPARSCGRNRPPHRGLAENHGALRGNARRRRRHGRQVRSKLSLEDS